MGRLVLAILISVSVFWHTVAGCCIHHVHAGPHRTAKRDDAEKALGCNGTHSHKHRSEAATRADEQSRECCPPEESPCDDPSECDEERCVFASPVPTDLAPVDDAGGLGWVVDLDAIAPVTSGCSARQISPFQLSGALPTGTLRLHLSLGVLQV